MLLCIADLSFAVAFSPDAFIRVKRSASQAVPKVATAGTLTNYMRLPVESYCGIELPMRAKLTLASIVWPQRSGTNEFALRVPPLSFAIPLHPLAVEPLVFAKVYSQADCVQIMSDECTLSGSPFVESLHLNERFTFRVRMLLRWDDSEKPTISADTRIEADVETPSMFALVPRRLLESIAESAMALVLQQLQRTFLRNLAADYARWATDTSYRNARSEQLHVPLDDVPQPPPPPSA